MQRTVLGGVVCLGMSACGGTGDWVVETWGEEFIEQEIPAEVFADGCSVRYETFEVAFGVELLDGDGASVGSIAPAAYDLTAVGPAPLGTVEVPADHYSEVRVEVAPDGSGRSVLADGTLTCGDSSAHFRWSFSGSTVYSCAPEDLTIPAGGSDATQITIHGDHLWYDGLEDPDAAVRGQEKLDADDGDGELTLEELAAVSIPALGYSVGEFSDVLTLDAFVAHLTGTLVHIDGEGECRTAAR